MDAGDGIWNNTVNDNLQEEKRSVFDDVEMQELDPLLDVLVLVFIVFLIYLAYRLCFCSSI